MNIKKQPIIIDIGEEQPGRKQKIMRYKIEIQKLTDEIEELQAEISKRNFRRIALEFEIYAKPYTPPYNKKYWEKK